MARDDTASASACSPPVAFLTPNISVAAALVQGCNKHCAAPATSVPARMTPGAALKMFEGVPPSCTRRRALLLRRRMCWRRPVAEDDLHGRR